MPHLFIGFSGIASGVGIFIIVWLVVCSRTAQFTAFAFDAPGENGRFEKLLPVYLRVAEVIIGLAAGSIVLLIGSSAFRTGGQLPWFFASPLFLLAFSIIYGILFMVFVIFDYEAYRHHPDSQSYTRLKYTKNQALGFSGLFCFCVGYAWLIITVTR